MTVIQLREALKTLPDNLEIVRIDESGLRLLNVSKLLIQVVKDFENKIEAEVWRKQNNHTVSWWKRRNNKREK